MLHDEQFSGLSQAQLDQIDAVCKRYEATWTPESGSSLEQHLASVAEELRAPLFRELLSKELDHLFRNGRQAPITEYLSRFPDRTEVVQQVFEAEQDRRAEAATQILKNQDTDSFSCAAVEPAADLPREFGRYRLLKLLGRGGMGSVYLAHDTELDRRVALKMPEFGPNAAGIQTTIDRFKREARAMATVSHPNLCQIYDVGERDGHPYLTMAFIDGRALSDLLAAQQSFSADEAARIVLALARAMEAVHRAGIVHRDLKPGNVMFNLSGEPIVMDFGLASRDAASEVELTHSGLIIGSPAYMAPEQVSAIHEQIGPRTDVYALGVILYQLLTRRRPFEGAGLSVLGQISSGLRPLPPSKFAVVPSRIEAICMKAMAHRIEDRYQSAAELAAALEACTSQPESPARRVRWKLPAAGVGLAALVLVAWIVVQNRHTAPEIQKPLAGPGSSTVEDARPPAGAGQGQPIENAVSKSPLISEEYEWSEPVNLGAAVNTERWNDHPTVTADGRTLVFVKYPEGQSSQIWQSTRDEITQPFGAAKRLFEDAGSYNDHCPFLSHDGLTLWFYSTRPIAPGRSDQNLWVARRGSTTEPFEEPQPLGPEINTTANEGDAFVSADGLTLLFTRGFPTEIFQATRKSESDDFGGAHVLDVGIAGVWNGFPRLTADGRVLLFAARVNGQRLWQATRDSVDAKFGRPRLLDATVNVGEVSGPFLSADEKTLYFSSTRPGGFGSRDLWSSTRVKKGSREAESPTSETEPPNSDGAPSPPGVSAFDPKIAAEKNFSIRLAPGAHVEMPTLKLDGAGPQTVEAWVTPLSKVQADKHVFGWFGPCSLFVRIADSCWTFGLDHTDEFQFVYAPQPITPGRRVHVATVRTGQEIRLFVDGRRVASDREHQTPFKSLSEPFSLSAAHAPSAFSGVYDEVRVSRVARYDENFVPKSRWELDADTTALYHCDENGGEQLLDSSDNKHHGKIIGKATWIGVRN